MVLTCKAPSGNTVNNIHDYQGIGGQSVDCAGATLNFDQIWMVAYYTPSQCMFSWGSEYQMPIWGHWRGLWISIQTL